MNGDVLPSTSEAAGYEFPKLGRPVRGDGGFEDWLKEAFHQTRAQVLGLRVNY